MTIDTLKHTEARKWVDEVTALCTPDSVYVCDGSAAEYDRLMKKLVDVKLATPLQLFISLGSFRCCSCGKPNVYCFKKRRRCRPYKPLD